ncbi:MAG TPA: cell division protein ZipA C-terminal FtsZ-binding domain-containing protein [Burkholderiaceae bacterium]|mgnify:CR=1 FL=1|nr:cell division protein ZipA C-terminal FtsZ-binding domain-containing protein [Burkholderiaceae bacterium]
MSTLTLTLILLVAATLAAVAAVNLLQARRNRAHGKPPPRGAGGTPGEASRGEPSLALDEAVASVDDRLAMAAESASPARSRLDDDRFDPGRASAAGEGADRFDPSFDAAPAESADGPDVRHTAAGTVARRAPADYAGGHDDASRSVAASVADSVAPPVASPSVASPSVASPSVALPPGAASPAAGAATRPDLRRPMQPADPARAPDAGGPDAPATSREPLEAGATAAPAQPVTATAGPGRTAATAAAGHIAAAGHTATTVTADTPTTAAAPVHAATTAAPSGPAVPVPAASSSAAASVTAHGHVAEADARAIGGLPSPDPRTSARRAPDRPALGELSDCIIELPLHGPQSGERLLMQTQSLRRVGAKPILFEGLLREPSRGAPGEGGPQWAPLLAGQQYRSLRAGVLLANRHGPLNAMEFSEFIAGVNGLASQFGVATRNPDMTPVLERARELDSLCIQLDAQVGVNVDCAQPLIPADLARVAIEQDLVERGNNRYARLNAAGQVLFSVSLADEPNRLTFLLDVPRAPAVDEPWQQLVTAAQAIAARLQGALVDDGARPLATPSLARIGQQLAQRYESLEQAGFPAGSALALRLFN